MNVTTLDKTILNVKISKDLKSQAQALADDIGIPLSTVVIANLKEFVRARTFSASALPRLNQMIESEITEAIEDYKAGKNISPKLATPNEVSSYLSSL